MILNALSIDVEEYYNGVEFEAAISAGKISQLPSRVELSLHRVLSLLAETNLQATFFVVGAVAAQHPELIKKVHRAGHEIACHSYGHHLVSRQTPAEFRADVSHAKALLEDITGCSIIGYRAPNYSIGREQAWAFDALLEEGFLYDSSIYPITHDRYGDPWAPRFPYEIRRSGGRCLIEFPIGTARLFGRNLPIGGGGYFRLFPTKLFRQGFHRVNVREQQPIMFYFHPWELDPHQPRPPMPWHHRFRHYVNLHRFESKLQKFLAAVPFTTAREVLALN